MVSSVKLQVVNELHRSVRRNFRRRRTIIKGYGDLWQIDLAEMQPYADQNRGFRYILVVIDCYSKYVWTCPIKNKTAQEVSKAMKTVLEDTNYKPKNIQSDQGTEFYNRYFTALMKQYHINHYSTFSTKKAAIVERVIRTLKNWLYKEFSANGQYKWLTILSQITQKYNNSFHRTIGMKPADVTPYTQLSVYNYPKVAPKSKFHIGDIVRISKYKGLFEKGYTPNWSAELFKIIKVNITNPVTYLIEDMTGQPIRGSFYTNELQKTKYPDVYLVEKILRRIKRAKGGDRVYVKWWGLPSKDNSWINGEDIV